MWTTLRVDHMPTAATATKMRFAFGSIGHEHRSPASIGPSIRRPEVHDDRSPSRLRREGAAGADLALR